jgi:DNA adenine methylase
MPKKHEGKTKNDQQQEPEPKRESPSRPVLRYHGGKWRLASWIIAHFPAHRVYVEAFGGGGSVLLRKPRSYAEVYNDLDDEVVNLFYVLRDPTLRARLVESVGFTPFARQEFDDSYKITDDPAESARRMVVLSHMGFGTAAMRARKKGIGQRTGFRANTTRSGTTPAHDWRGMPGVLAAVGERMTGVVIEHRPAAQVIETHDGPGTLHYVDPPYPHDTRADSSRWNYRHEMSDDDHRTLAATLHALSGMVVLSGYACALYDNELFADWHRVQKATHADGARNRTEVLWLNPACAAALVGSSLLVEETPNA